MNKTLSAALLKQKTVREPLTVIPDETEDFEEEDEFAMLQKRDSDELGAVIGQRDSGELQSFEGLTPVERKDSIDT
mgnify:CR=1 FL=1